MRKRLKREGRHWLLKVRSEMKEKRKKLFLWTSTVSLKARVRLDQRSQDEWTVSVRRCLIVCVWMEYCV